LLEYIVIENDIAIFGFYNEGEIKNGPYIGLQNL